MPLTLCEVGPRDGLQNLERTFSIAERVTLIDELSAAGLKRIEAVSFVNDRKAPRMAGAEEVLAAIVRRPGLMISGLVLNSRGVERALASALDEVRFVVVATETLSVRNQGASLAESLETFRAMANPVKSAGRRLTGVIGAAFGCPFEGAVAPSRVAGIVEALVAAGADGIVLADTIGVAAPTDVEALAAATRAASGSAELGFHFHNTRNTGFANAFAAIRAGADVLDASIGGLGGCPFAPRATGNIATEDLLYMLRRMGITTGVDLPAMLAVAERLQVLLGAPVPGQVARAGLFPEIAAAHQFASQPPAS